MTTMTKKTFGEMVESMQSFGFSFTKHYSCGKCGHSGSAPWGCTNGGECISDVWCEAEFARVNNITITD